MNLLSIVGILVAISGIVFAFSCLFSIPRPSKDDKAKCETFEYFLKQHRLYRDYYSKDKFGE